MVVMRLRAATYLILSLLALPSVAQVDARFNRATAAPGETFNLQITVQGSDVGTPILPDSDNFQILNRDRPQTSYSQQVQATLQGIHTVTQRTWVYRMRVDTPGRHALPPIRCMVDGKEVASGPLSINIAGRSSQPPPPPPNPRTDRMPSHGGPRDEAARSNPQITFDDTILFEAEVSKTEVFVGEGIDFVLRHGRLTSLSVQLLGSTQLLPPQIQSFYMTTLQRTQDVRLDRGPLHYVADEFSQRWFPTQPGEFTLPQLEWSGQVGAQTRYGFDVQGVAKQTNPVTIKVKPLPPGPPNFSGAVGTFEAEALLPSRDLLQGSPVDFAFRVTGDGNLASITAPPIPDLDWAHLSIPRTDGQDGKNAQSEKRFTYTFTPLEAGEHTLPALSFVYFSPEDATFKTFATEPIVARVRPAAVSGPMVVVGGNAEDAVGNTVAAAVELRPILVEGATFATPRSGTLLNMTATLFPPAAYAALLLVVRRKRRLGEDPEYAREYFARAKSTKRLRAIPTAQDPTEALYRALAGFVADKLNVPEAGMTSPDIKRLLEGNAAPPELTESIVRVLRACERARYAGARHSSAELNALLQAAEPAMDQFEDWLKQRKRP